MRRILLMLALVVCSACQSKPSKESLSAKATPHAMPTSVEISALVAYAPRPAQDVENTVLLNAKIQSCLRAAEEVRAADFTVGIEGQMGYNGGAESLKFTHSSANLKACLAKELPALQFGRGKSGPFKMQIMRGPSTGKKNKAVLLELHEGKKWE